MSTYTATSQGPSSAQRTMINTGHTVYYHGSDTELHGHRYRVVSSYPVGLKPRYDLAEVDDPTRTPVLTGVRASSLVVIVPSAVEVYNRRAFGLAGLR